MKIVCFGGGTGLPILLRGLRQNDEETAVTAVVCVSDNGGSSGSLRQAFGIPAVGDLRNCLVALASGDSPLGDLFQHRLGRGDGLSGHALGNLIVTALCERTGSLREAVNQAADLLQARGNVLPSTEEAVTLCAEFEDGAVVRGETQVALQRGRIAKMWLEPESLLPTPGLFASIEPADVIVFGPGSLFTSTLPNLLIPGVAAAIRESSALKILVCNLMTQPGETDGFRASDHLTAVEKYLGQGTIDVCILNSGETAPGLLADACAAGSHPVQNDMERIEAQGVRAVVSDVLGRDGLHIRHDSIRLASMICSLAREVAGDREPENELVLAAG